MWLQKELRSICLKEFRLRHQLDIIQESPYIAFNLDQLISLGIEYSSCDQSHWQYLAERCNLFWYNIVGYLNLFPHIFKILNQKDYFIFNPAGIRKETFIGILRERIHFSRTFVEIAKTIAYRAHLKEVFAKSVKNKDLFDTLSAQCNYSDSAGDKLLALGNRILFIRDWTAKLVIKHKNTIIGIHKSPPSYILPDAPQFADHHSPSKDQIIADTKESSKRRIVSIVKPFIKFSSKRPRIKNRRLSDILDDDSDSSISTDSIWLAPFANTKSKSKK